MIDHTGVHFIIPPHTLAVLEFGKILPELAQRADSAWGKELASQVRPAAAHDRALEDQAELAEWQALESGDPTPPGLGLPEVRPTLGRAAHPGAILEPGELVDLARVAAVSRVVGDVLAARSAEVPRLAATAGPHLGRFLPLEQAVAQAIDERGRVRDEASPALRRLRRQIESGRAALVDRLERLAAKIGPGSFVTQRSGRYSVAVPTDRLGGVKGVIHDRSASEATVFLEPFEAVELGNRLREDEEEERQEMRRILASLTAKVGGVAAELLGAAAELAHFDLLRAKFRLFRDWACVLPELRFGGPIDLQGARHPLLARARAALDQPVVPLDLRLGGEARILVITGPNMGGKTVALKTLGLLTLMGMAGLGIPAREGAILGFFPTIVADIGDEQSIEENLSTFASHVRNLREALDHASPAALVLLDELGAGTDPAEGAALGQAVLEQLAASGALAVVTTHHGALKGMATDHRAIVNASMAFDPDSHSPLYALVSGLPGRSFGIEMAEHLGFPSSVLARARALVPEEERRLGDLLADVEKRRREVVQAQVDLESTRDVLEALLDKYRERLAAIRELRDRVLNDARGRVGAVLEEAEGALREARRILRAAGERAAASSRVDEAHAPLGPLGREVDALRSALKVIADDAPGSPAVERDETSSAQGGGRPAVVLAGQSYWVPELAAMVEVVRPPNAAGRVVVHCRGRRLTLAVDRLRVATSEARAAAREPAPPAEPQVEVGMPASFEIDLRGLTGDEGVAEVERYLEQAAVHGLKMVRIIHGKGTGALRMRVQDVLRDHPRVAAFRLGEAGEGGAGVTVVEIS